MSRKRALLRGLALTLGMLIIASLGLYWFAPGVVVRTLVTLAAKNRGLERGDITVDGTRMPLLAGGTGEPIVFVHGYADSKESWLDVAGAFTSTHFVYVPDLPGYGEAAMPSDGDLGVEKQAERVAEFIRSTGRAPVHLAGISMGGEIAGIVAARHPKLVRSLALFNAAGGVSDTSTLLFRQIGDGANPFDVQSAADLRALVAKMRVKPIELPGVVERAVVQSFASHRAAWNKAFEGLKSEPARSLLDSLAPSIAVPTWLFWGAEDALFHPSIARRLQSRIAGARLTMVPNCGHACAFEQAAQTAATYRDFIATASR
jgi:abhydrolase domain-containing protein 6